MSNPPNEDFQDLVVAKWKSIARHVANKHEDHGDEMFTKCAHDAIEPRRWIKIGM